MSNIVYFIPGTMCDKQMWEPLWSLLPASIIPVYIPIPHGDNISDITASIDTLICDDNIALVGFSLGGYLASYIATYYPNKVSKLLVLSNSPSGLPDVEINERNKIIAYVEEFGYAGISKERVNDFLHETNKDNVKIIDTMISMDRRCGKDTLLNQLKTTTLRNDLTQALSTINIPVHFCFGDNDNLVNPVVLKNIIKNNPHTKMHQMKNSGHLLPLERPELVAQIMEQWITL